MVSLQDKRVKLHEILQVAWVSALPIEPFDRLNISKPDHLIKKEVELGRQHLSAH